MLSNPFRKRPEPSREFTGNCFVKQTTGDGDYVGRCYHSTYDGDCPLHGDVTIWLTKSGAPNMFPDNWIVWPYDHELRR